MRGIYTLGQVAERFGVQLWQVRRLYERGILPEPERVGTSRVVGQKDLAGIERALREAGYAVRGPAPATAESRR